MRMDVSQYVRLLEPMCEHQLLVTQKLVCGAISDDQALIEHDGA